MVHEKCLTSQPLIFLTFQKNFAHSKKFTSQIFYQMSSVTHHILRVTVSRKKEDWTELLFNQRLDFSLHYHNILCDFPEVEDMFKTKIRECMQTKENNESQTPQCFIFRLNYVSYLFNIGRDNDALAMVDECRGLIENVYDTDIDQQYRAYALCHVWRAKCFHKLGHRENNIDALAEFRHALNFAQSMDAGLIKVDIYYYAGIFFRDHIVYDNEYFYMSVMYLLKAARLQDEEVAKERTLTDVVMVGHCYCELAQTLLLVRSFHAPAYRYMMRAMKNYKSVMAYVLEPTPEYINALKVTAIVCKWTNQKSEMQSYNAELAMISAKSADYWDGVISQFKPLRTTCHISAGQHAALNRLSDSIFSDPQIAHNSSQNGTA